ncbi:MAG: RluA family pseudouridine synthase [Thermodesulfovibrionales bacterium]|nr:RluA family pseudouridine synthase [Thermodesulfovibrionales bacterium]
MEKTIKVLEHDSGKRLDIFGSEMTGISRSQIQKLIREELILVNNYRCQQSYRVKTDDIITFKIPKRESPCLIPEPIPINILYVDDYLIVVDKPPNMVVYPAAGHSKGTLLNAVYYHTKKLASVGGPLRNGIVHRLDKDTSGVMVIALEEIAYYKLIEEFKRRAIKRKYKALVYGILKEDTGNITFQIGRSISDRKKMSIRTKRGKESITHWRVIERFKEATLIEAVLGTGRTHQIRVHFSAIGHPLLGDRVYGKKTSLQVNNQKIIFPRQMLHAYILGFRHPTTDKYMEFFSDLPSDFRECIERLKKNS